MIHFKKVFFAIGLVSQMAVLSATETIHDDGSNVKWTAVFENQVPRSKNTTQAYCDTHTPTVIITDIKQITSKSGVNAVNGVNIRYLSYDSKESDGLHFNIVKGELSGTEKNGKKWTQSIILYEQTLEEVGKTYTVWSTKYCKGIFTGYPTVWIKQMKLLS